MLKLAGTRSYLATWFWTWVCSKWTNSVTEQLKDTWQLGLGYLATAKIPGNVARVTWRLEVTRQLKDTQRLGLGYLAA